MGTGHLGAGPGPAGAAGSSFQRLPGPAGQRTLPEDTAPEEPDIRQLAAENRRQLQMTVLAVVGGLAVMPGCVAFAFLCALRYAAVSTRYMLYRHMAAGEYASAPFSFRLPLLLSAALSVFLRKRRKWRQTKRRRPSGAASLYPF